ncbi:MAG: hypothetical protein LM577_04480 [Thermoproteaceae archaeon]|nr:hypothetical protein [Thermoproteaceae archaeon]
MALWGKAGVESSGEIVTRSRFGESRAMFIKISRPKVPLRLSNDVYSIMHALDYDYVLCLDRQLILLCRSAARKLGVLLITYMDSPKYLHAERAVTVREGLARPAALAWYITTGLLSDVTVCVSKYIEERLSAWGIGATTTIEPSYALLHESSDMASNNDDNVDEVGNDAVFCSCPLELTAYIALRSPDVPVVITGPHAYYFREYLKKKGLADRLRNVHLLHNISDRALERLHSKIAISLVARPVLSGVSMTLVQELYFGKVVVTDWNSASRITGLLESGAVVVGERYAEWPKIIKGLMRGDRAGTLGIKAKQFFDTRLSPWIFAKSFERVLAQISHAR